MEKSLNRIVTAAGVAVIGLVFVQPALAQRDSALMLNQLVSAFGASPAHTSCDALQGQSREDCLLRRSSPSVTEGGSAVAGADRFTGDAASAGATASAGTSAPSGRIAGDADYGANPAHILCDALQGKARADCFAYSTTRGLQQGYGD